MKGFSLYHVLSASGGMSEIYHLVREHGGGITSKWLISVTDVDPPDEFMRTFNLTNENLLDHLMNDSGGYSIATGRVIARDLPPEKILGLYRALTPEKAIGPDVPNFNLYDDEIFTDISFRQALRISKYRSDLVIKGMQGCPSKFLHVIQGHLKRASLFTLHYRKMWLVEITKDEPRAHGLALAGLLNVRNPMVIAYYALQSWAEGYSICHILGKGAITQIPLYVALAHLAYDELSSDCTTYTIKVFEYPSFVMTNEKGRLVKVSVSRNIPLIPRFECECSLCVEKEKEYGDTLYDLIKQNHDGLSVMAYLGPWLAAHNVISINKYIHKLNEEFAEDRVAFLRSLLNTGQLPFLAAIKFAEEVISAGPDQYESFLNKINNCKRKTELEGLFHE